MVFYEKNATMSMQAYTIYTISTTALNVLVTRVCIYTRNTYDGVVNITRLDTKFGMWCYPWWTIGA